MQRCLSTWAWHVREGRQPACLPGSLAAAAAAARRCGVRARRPRLSWLVGAACRTRASTSGRSQRAARQGHWSGLRRAGAVLRGRAASGSPRGGRGTGHVRLHAQRPLRRRPPEARRHGRRGRRRGAGRCGAEARGERSGRAAAAGRRHGPRPGAGQVGGRLDAPQGRQTAAQARQAAPAGARLVSTGRPVDPASAQRVRRWWYSQRRCILLYALPVHHGGALLTQAHDCWPEAASGVT